MKTETLLAKEQLNLLDRSRLPQHIAIIPDGNRRWALSHMENASYGHRHGANNLISIMRAAKEIGIRIVTFYTFSTENWNRPADEVEALMGLLEEYLKEQQQTMIAEGICLKTIGDLAPLPPSVRSTVAETVQRTAHCAEITMVLAINYGGRAEICRACRHIAEDAAAGKFSIQQIDEELFRRYLETSAWPDPDLFIRTSGEMRISNFMIWQFSYSELYVADTLWPDFTARHLFDAVLSYQQRERRLGN